MNILRNDSLLGRFFGKIGDIILLNILFIICSIPIFTIGISYTSMEYAFMKQLKESDTSLCRAFFKSFKENFRQSTISWIIIIFLSFVTYVDINIFRPNGIMPYLPLYYLFLLVSFIICFSSLFLFPVIAAFKNNLKNLWIQAFFLAAKNIPYTLLMCIIFIVPLYLTFTDLDFFLLYLTLWIVFGFGLIGYIYSIIFLHIFKPYLND
jgi:uncharacterized membrane protein YesL